MLKSVKINGLKIYGFESKKDLIECIDDKKVILISAAAESIIRNDKNFNDIAEGHIAYPDGIGAVMALKQKGIKSTKIPGAELWLDVLKANPEKQLYLLGSSHSVIKNTAEKIKIDFPNLDVVGYRDGYFKPEEFENIKNEILNLKPDLVFVALGQPRQEYIAEDLFSVHPALYMGLGGSFDIYGGDKKRAPKIFIDLGLEWLYRLLKEPTRIGRQMVLVKFLGLLFLRRL
jgi:UDP-N-acetyl-D-mannosaminouronate:lipid I N-acetyl-D-mannosaminouronosyltransferase